MNGGRLHVVGLHDMTFKFAFHASRLADCVLWVDVKSDEFARSKRAPRLHFKQVTLAGVELTIVARGADVVFDDCVFKAGSMTIKTTGPGGDKNDGSVVFADCLFETDMFASSRWGPKAKLQTGSLVVKENCRFENGAMALSSFSPESV